MSSERWRRVEDLCHAVLAKRHEDRRPFLERACDGDEVLLREVDLSDATVAASGDAPRSGDFAVDPV